ncbi:MAG: AMP-binding protein [Actinobacteria bacterium]|nr:AMP-binding protein [Actinomycetota bacterium]
MHIGLHADAHPDKPAIVMGGSGVVTYQQLDDRSKQLSQLFHSIGLRPGDHVAWCVENTERFHELIWGAQRSGLLYTAISTRLTDEEIQYIVEDCGAKAFIASSYVADATAALAGKLAGVDAYFALGGAIDGYESYEEAVAAQPAESTADECEGDDMLYSSGTTGRPKGVKPAFSPKPWGSAHAVTLLGQALYGATEESVYLSPAPLYHAAPLRFTREFQRIGATVIVMEKFDPADFLRLVEEHGVTHTQVVPTMFVRMLKLPEAERTKHELSSLQCVIHAAAPCPVRVKEQMIEWWGPIINEYYAATEGGGFMACTSAEWLAHEGTVGKPLIGTLHVCDDDTGEELPTGEAGTVYLEPPNPEDLFEYHNDPEKTRQSRHPQHPDWFTLGDVGYLDDDGYLYLTDRKAFMIITGGVNVYPQEAENLLVTHDRVMDVAVFGVPNEDFGEEVKAVVQPIDMTDAGPELERELLAFCREHLADVKCPRSIDFVEELPRHPTGKLYKRLLRDQYWEGHESKI